MINEVCLVEHSFLSTYYIYHVWGLVGKRKEERKIEWRGGAKLYRFTTTSKLVRRHGDIYPLFLFFLVGAVGDPAHGRHFRYLNDNAVL